VLFSVFGLFATNLFFYAYINPSFSHVYSFAAITSFYYFITLFFKSRQKQHLFFSAFMLGIVVLIRPVNLLAILAVPFFAGGFSLFWMHLRNTISVKWLLTSVVIFLFALLPMFVISYLQTGSLIIYGYQNEGFYFLRPHFFDFLFSFKKGWFLYTPAMLLLFPAGVFLFRHQRSGFYAFSFFLIILIYVFSSWWNWFYGDSFGMRPMVDFYGLFILIIALFATKIKSYSAKMTLLVFVGLTIFLNIFQSYQYAVGIIHPDSMTKQGYWHVFLERDEEFRGVIAGGDEYFYGKLDETPLLSSLNTIDRLPSGWNLNDNTVIVDKDSKSLVVEQNSDFIYSPSYSFPYPENSKYGKHVYVNFGFKFLEKSPNAALNALVVIDISDSLGQHPFYKAFRFKRLPDNENSSWRDASVGFKLPPYHTDYKQVKLYVWNKNAQDYLLDSLHVTLYNY